MFKVGELIIYSAHGICQIDDICEKTYSGVTKTYYVLHPLNNVNLIINTPVDNKLISMVDIMSEDKARDVLKAFTSDGIDWIDKSHQRTQAYSEVAKTGDRIKIAEVITTLMRKKDEIERSGKKFAEYDRKLLSSMQNILFGELAIALKVSIDEIHSHINELLGIEDDIELTVQK